MSKILLGAPVAQAITEDLQPRIRRIEQRGHRLCLAILRVGDEPSQLAYERAAEKRCAQLGIYVKKLSMERGVSQKQVLGLIDQINTDESIHGCLMLRPLPEGLDEWAVCQALSPRKDVDGITQAALATVFTGHGEGYPPCTAQAVMELLDYYKIELSGAHAAIIGRSLVVGRPLAMLLQARDATVTMCHSHSRQLPQLCTSADILISAAGKIGMVDESLVSPNHCLIDVGINQDVQGQLCGDVCFEQLQGLVKAISPVPGGVGAITTAVLAKHLVCAGEKAEKIRNMSE